MKLEAKHLAPYLPYGLKVRYNNKEYLVHAIDVKGRLMLETEPMYVVFMNIKYVKPILRPLSSMSTEEIEKLNSLIKNDIVVGVPSGNWAYPEFMSSNSWVSCPTLSLNGISMLNEYLFSNNFDVFRLISKGLAIDKNINTK